MIIIRNRLLGNIKANIEVKIKISRKNIFKVVLKDKILIKENKILYRHIHRISTKEMMHKL